VSFVVILECFDQSSKSCVNIGEVITVGGLKKKCTGHGSFKVIPKRKRCYHPTFSG